MQTLEQLWNVDGGSLLLIVVRTVVVYCVVLVALRVAGKRELGQMTPFDLVVLLILANAVQNAMVGPDQSLNGGLLAAITILFLNWLLAAAGLRSMLLRRRLLGTPTVLVNDGEFVAANLRREGVTEDEVLQALREHGMDELALVKLAVLEVDGTISVIPAGAKTMRTRRVRGRAPGV